MFVDELTFDAKAGNGGDGVVRWLQLKFQPKGGPAGGNGGRGGSVHIRAVRNLNILSKYTGNKSFNAQNGEAGRKDSQYGHHGEDLYIDLPIGSQVTDTEHGTTYLLEREGDAKLILKGGNGGLGNEHFKSSTNRTPMESTKGKIGESGVFFVELSLVADAGLVGLPNAGKSTLLNTLTHAHAAVGAYPFTTLEPHLGDLFGFILADIPGLIEGASGGKGLGHKFLRHVEKTKMLLHCVSFEHEDMLGAYQTVRMELKAHSASLAEKPEWILLTKSELPDEEKQKTILKSFMTATNPHVFAVSAHTGEGIKELRDALVKEFRAKSNEEAPTV